MREQKKDITMHIVNRIIVFSFVAFVFLLLFSYDTSPLYKWCHSDTVNYMLEGILVEKGLVPYIDFFEHKGPLMFVIQWMGAMLTGNKIGFLLIEIPFLTVTLYGSYKIIDLFYNDQRKSIIITIIALLLNRIYFAGNMTEDYCIPFLVWSMYFVVKYFKCDIDNDIEHNVKYAFFYGITFMVCVLIRMTNFLPISVMIITGTVLLAVNKKWSNILKNIVAFIIGAVLVLVPFVIYYIKKNAIYEMFYGTIIHNIKYTLNTNGILLNAGVFTILIVNLNLLMSLLIAISNFVTNKKERIVSLSLMISAIVGIVVQLGMRPNLNYMYIWFPVYIVACGMTADLVQNNKIINKVFGIFTLILISLNLSCAFISTKSMISYDVNKLTGIEKDAKEITKLIPEKSRNSVLAYNVKSEYYIVTDIVPCYKYFMLQDWMCSVNDEMQEEFKEYIESGQAKYIVENGENNIYNENDGTDNDLDYIIDEKYEEIGRNDSFVLMKRK